jgi:hypothetical protein
MADETPERPNPTTRTLLFFNSIGFQPRPAPLCHESFTSGAISVPAFRMIGCSSGSPLGSASAAVAGRNRLEDGDEALLLAQGRLVMLDHVAHRHRVAFAVAVAHDGIAAARGINAYV